jgi:hypothetical protein
LVALRLFLEVEKFRVLIASSWALVIIEGHEEEVSSSEVFVRIE